MEHDDGRTTLCLKTNRNTRFAYPHRQITYFRCFATTPTVFSLRINDKIMLQGTSSEAFAPIVQTVSARENDIIRVDSTETGITCAIVLAPISETTDTSPQLKRKRCNDDDDESTSDLIIPKRKKGNQKAQKATLGSALFAPLVEAVRSETVFFGESIASDAVMNEIAEELFGLNLMLLSECARDESGTSSPAAHLHLRDGVVSAPFETCLALYGNTQSNIAIQIPAPKHLSRKLAHFFDLLDFGTSLIDSSTCTSLVKTSVMMIKKTVQEGEEEEGEEALRLRETFSGLSLLIFQVDEEAKYTFGLSGGNPVTQVLETGQTLFIPASSVNAPEGLREVEVITEGCAVLVMGFATENFGRQFAEYVKKDTTNGNFVDYRPTIMRGLARLATMDAQHTAHTLRMTELFTHDTDNVDTSSASSTRRPLLDGTLHANISASDFLSLIVKELPEVRGSAALPSLCVASTPTFVSTFLHKGCAWWSSQSEGSAKVASPHYARLLEDTYRTVLKSSAPLLQTNSITNSVVVDGEEASQYFPVHYRNNRQDMGQKLDGGPAHELLKCILGETPVGGMLREVLGNGRLVEFSCLLSFPGSVAQPPHSDSMARSLSATSSAHLVSCFVPLLDVGEAMGPLEVWPGTHSTVQLLPESLKCLQSEDGLQYREFMSEREEFDAGVSSEEVDVTSYERVRMTVPRGSVVLMDSRLYHRGSANVSHKTRPVLYFTFASESGRLPEGSTYSLSSSLQGKDIRLNQFVASPPSPPSVKVALKEYPAEEVLKMHLHDGDVDSILSRIAPSSSRAIYAESSVNDTETDLHDSLVGAQEALLEAYNSEKGTVPQLEGILEAFKWCKSSADSCRRGGIKRSNGPAMYRTYQRGGSSLGVKCDDTAKTLFANGAVVSVAAREDFAEAVLTHCGYEPAPSSGTIYLLHNAVQNTTTNERYTPERISRGTSFIASFSGAVEVVLNKGNTVCDATHSTAMLPGRFYRIPEGVVYRMYNVGNAGDSCVVVEITAEMMKRSTAVTVATALKSRLGRLKRWGESEWGGFAAVRQVDCTEPKVVPKLITTVPLPSKHSMQGGVLKALETSFSLNPFVRVEVIGGGGGVKGTSDAEVARDLQRLVRIEDIGPPDVAVLAEGALRADLFRVTLVLSRRVYMLSAAGLPASLLRLVAEMHVRQEKFDPLLHTASTPITRELRTTLTKNNRIFESLCLLGIFQ